MMMTLTPELPIDPEETLLSYTDRLSMMHTGKGMERLLRDLAIHHEHFVSGRADAIAMLAETIGRAPEVLSRSAIRVFQRGASFRGEDISKAFLSPRAARYCPACLAEDGKRADRRFRLIWGFRHVARCDRHGLWLEVSPTTKATTLRLALDTLPLPVGTKATEDAPDYVAWLRGRLSDEHPNQSAWLSGQTLEQVLAASEMLGAILEHGHKVAVTKLSLVQTEEATDIGFAIYQEGPKAIEEALDTIRQTSTATAVQAGPLAYYGKLFDWLDRRSNAIDPGPIRDILRDHIVKHGAVEPGTTVLGVEIMERRFHSLQSLAQAVDIKRLRLARLLKKLGEIPPEASELECGNMVFDAAQTVPLVEAFKTAIPLQEVAEYLGASQRQVEVLYRGGIVRPLIPRTSPGSVRDVVVSRKHLDEILGKVSVLPKAGEATLGELHSVAYACQHGAGPFEDVFRNILEGRTPAFRHPEKLGISAICVDLSSLAALNKSA